jgi:hypothetical protein
LFLNNLYGNVQKDEGHPKQRSMIAQIFVNLKMIKELLRKDRLIFLKTTQRISCV